MKAIEKYIDALQKCDNKGLSELFAVEGSLCDYCRTALVITNTMFTGARRLTCSLKINSRSVSI